MNSNFGISLLSALESLATSTPVSGQTPGNSGSDSPFQQTMLQLLNQMNPSNTSGNANASTPFSSLSASENSSSSFGSLGSFSMEMMMISLLTQMIKKQEAASTSLAPAAAPAKTEPSGVPVHGPISQGSHPGHVAIDFAVVVGTPVQATMDGKVVYAGWNNDGYGNLVIVENGAHRTYYAHNSQIPVKVGDAVHSGDVVAYSGSTGHSTGPHVHYETRVNGICVDPTASLG
jgi:murein DD-endopeptidase MepM/ murein hydrolase activator NlpD